MALAEGHVKGEIAAVKWASIAVGAGLHSVRAAGQEGWRRWRRGVCRDGRMRV